MSSFEENRRRPLLVILGLAILLGGGYFAYQKFTHKEEVQAAPQMPPAKVRVHDVVVQDVPLNYEYAGRTNGSREVEIRARVSGILMKRSYVEGQAVKQGDVLFTIDQAPFKVALAQAEARFSQANNDWSRASKLYSAQAISARERDQARANYAQTKAEVETARINLGYTTVTAPISGVTSQESLSEGSLVTADTSLLTRLTQLDPMYVNFSAPDSEVLGLRQMMADGEMIMSEDGILHAEIHFGNGSVYPLQGEVNFTDSIIDPNTGTVSNRAVVPNPDSLLMPGQFVRVVVKGLSRKNAMVVPDRAIMQGPQGPFVYIVNENGTAGIRPVTLGVLAGDMRLIASGLQEGDRVIYEGMIKVRPDAPVTIADEEGKEAPASEAAAPEAASPEAEQPQEEATAETTDALVPQEGTVAEDAAVEHTEEVTTPDATTEDVSDDAAAVEDTAAEKGDSTYVFGGTGEVVTKDEQNANAVDVHDAAAGTASETESVKE